MTSAAPWPSPPDGASRGLTLVLPVRDEAAAVGPLVERARAALGDLLVRIVAVDDASTDGTAAALDALADGEPPLEVIRLAARAGRGASFRIGAERAAGDLVAYLDADLQHDPADLARAAALARAGAALVCGWRVPDPGVPPLRRGLSAGFRLAARLLAGLPCRDPLAGFKLFRRDALPLILGRCRDPHWFFDYEAPAAARVLGLPVADLPVVFDRAAAGRTSKTRLLFASLDYLAKLARRRILTGRLP